MAASKKIVPKSADIIVRGLREDFAKFFDDPSRDGFREMIRNHGGELRELDFKAVWPATPALAKHVLAIANSGGGCLVMGATEDAQRIVHPTGLLKLADKADIASGLRRYVPDVLAAGVTIQDFSYNSSDYDALSGKCFQVLFVISNELDLPYVSTREGNGIAVDTIYVRREGMSHVANHEELQRLLNSRLETGVSTSAKLELDHELDQLYALYRRIPKYKSTLFSGSYSEMAMSLGGRPNESYPKEDFEQFVSKMIDAKKARIAQELGVKP